MHTPQTIKKAAAILLMMAGCDSTPSPSGNLNVSSTKFSQHYFDYGLTEFEIDGCGYIVASTGNGVSITHKGNCKNHAARAEKE